MWCCTRGQRCEEPGRDSALSRWIATRLGGPRRRQRLRADVERERDELDFRDVPDFRAVTRPPLAPACFTLIVRRVFDREDDLRAEVDFRREVVFFRAEV